MNPLESIRSSITASRALCAAATPGPWATSVTPVGTGMGHNDYADKVRIGIHDYTVAHQSVNTGDVEHYGGGSRLVNYTNAGKPEAGPDAVFIAHARQSLPAHVDALEIAIAALEFYAENAGNCARFSDESGNVARARLADFEDDATELFSQALHRSVSGQSSSHRRQNFRPWFISFRCATSCATR